jgi:hypothetical protein
VRRNAHQIDETALPPTRSARCLPTRMMRTYSDGASATLDNDLPRQDLGTYQEDGGREARSTGLRLVNPVPQGNGGNSERASNGGPKKRARVEVTVPQPLRSGPGGEARQEHNATAAQNKLPGRTSSQPTAHEFVRLLFLSWRSPRYRHRLRRIACQGSLDSQQPIRLFWLPGYAGRNLAARGRLTLPLVAQH